MKDSNVEIEFTLKMCASWTSPLPCFLLTLKNMVGKFFSEIIDRDLIGTQDTSVQIKDVSTET